jgi:parallel beta-helix repeat protein
MRSENFEFKRAVQTELVVCLILIVILACISPVEGTGSKTTIGDKILKTDQLRNQTQSDGENIPIGVISNGLAGMNSARSSGDLPEEIFIIRHGERSEGTAMLEIIHDIAPGAPLLYDDFGGGKDEEFVTAVENLITSGARVIVDDVGFLQVPYFEDGTSASRLGELLKNNPDVILVSAAGNNADAHYQGTFSPDANGYHSFNGQTGIPVTINPGGTITVFLQWDDPFGSSGNDFNLYLEENGKLIGMSERPQTGNEIPIEKFTYQNNGKDMVNAQIRVMRAGNVAEEKTLEIFINGRKDKITIPAIYLIPEDSIIGHAAIPEVISVAAISPNDIPNIAGFSSNGYVTIARPVPVRREKPDIVGVSGVDVTGSGGFPKKFSGTSAAAPHIAALIGLEWSLFPSLPAQDIKDALFESSLELGSPGWDPAFGYGLPDALKMYELLEAKAGGTTAAGVPPVIEIPDSILKPAEIPPGMIMGPVTITEPGVYTLGTDIFDYSGVIITVASSDVTIIGGGYAIEGTSVQFVDEMPIYQSGIVIKSPDNSRIRNVVLKDVLVTSTAGGISGSGVESLTIDGCQLPFNTNGIELKDSKDGIITNCVITGNSNTGLIVTDGSDNTTIENNKIRNNLFGLNTEGSTNNHLKNNDISDNKRDNETPNDTIPVVPASAPATKVPCKDEDFDGVCDTNKTSKPSTPTTTKPQSFSQTIEITSITPAYEPGHYDPWSDPGYYDPGYSPAPCPTCPETGEPLC